MGWDDACISNTKTRKESKHIKLSWLQEKLSTNRIGNGHQNNRQNTTIAMEKPPATKPSPETNQFIYDREIWIIPALVNRYTYQEDERNISRWEKFSRFMRNPVRFFGKKKKAGHTIHMRRVVNELGPHIERAIREMTDSDLETIVKDKQQRNQIIEMGRTAIIRNLEWKNYVGFFPNPVTDENRGLKFDWLGYFEVELEYYRGNAEMKRTIVPNMIQQVPIMIQRYLKDTYSTLRRNRFILIDTASPIYVAVFSKEMTEGKVEWSRETIMEYRKQIGLWTEIYSGHWPDYTMELYEDRIRGQLSNRASELHFIRRNSAFVCMEPENYKSHFLDRQSYMRGYFLAPIAEIRSMAFALAAMNESIDTLFLLQRYHFQFLGKKIETLQKTRGNIFNKCGTIYSQLERNPRAHYTKVVKFLLKEFEFETELDRMNQKLDVFQRTLQLTYQKETQRVQKRQDRKMDILNIMLGLGVGADLAYVLASAINDQPATNGEPPHSSSSKIYTAFFVPMIFFFLLGLFRWFQLYLDEWYLKKTRYRIRTEAIILNAVGNNIILEDRKYPPFANFLSLPGGYLARGEKPHDAIKRSIMEDLGIDVKVEGKLGTYESSDDDPRGRVISYVFRCSVHEPVHFRVKQVLKGAGFFYISEILEKSLAFNHNSILCDCVHSGEYEDTYIVVRKSHYGIVQFDPDESDDELQGAGSSDGNAEHGYGGHRSYEYVRDVEGDRRHVVSHQDSIANGIGSPDGYAIYQSHLDHEGHAWGSPQVRSQVLTPDRSNLQGVPGRPSPGVGSSKRSSKRASDIVPPVVPTSESERRSSGVDANSKVKTTGDASAIATGPVGGGSGGSGGARLV
mmetsp:Transcript_1980/g.3541  ORF Transcript_1980/g.3541 Transcript_1980/m.3541 type:complete len:850 (-) Transcript_1980:2-2551(-)